MFSPAKLTRSFRYALEGVLTAFREEQNFMIDCFCAVIVLLLGWFFGLSAVEFAVIVVTIGLVLGLELVNTAVEHLADVVDSSHNHAIKILKDISAAGVLVACIAALAVGVIIFTPHIMSVF